MAKNRISATFEALKTEGRGGLVTFLVAGDPDLETSEALLRALPAAGADLLEIGMPFSDPMADGPSIQLGDLRALKAGTTLRKTLDMVSRLRADDQATPIILMGYYNPIYTFGCERFLNEAKTAGVDGLIIVDLPPEEDDELCVPARNAGIEFVRLLTPTTDDKRLPSVLQNASGFLYYVSIKGTTGAAAPDADTVRQAVAHLRQRSNLPIAVGFGIRQPEQAGNIAKFADAAVVGSALVDLITEKIDDQGQVQSDLIQAMTTRVKALADGIRAAR